MCLYLRSVANGIGDLTISFHFFTNFSFFFVGRVLRAHFVGCHGSTLPSSEKIST